MARTMNDGFDGNAAGGKTPLVLQADGQDNITLPDASFVRDAQITQDGQDLILTAPDGSVVMIEGYFNADPAPMLSSADGVTLTPQLVESFAHHDAKYASTGGTNDESAVGTVQEVSGNATVTRTDGTVEQITIGTKIFQGDVVETDCDNCAVNIQFIDESSVVVSENARLAIDEYVFDPGSEAGVTNISILRGLFVFTSGLIGREDPDDVTINTPQGSIGIRGTIIAGNVDTGEITVLEGAIVLRTFDGAEVTLSERFETARFDTANNEIVSMGRMDATSFTATYEPVRSVSPQLFSGIEADGSTPGADPNPAPGDAPARQETAPEAQPQIDDGAAMQPQQSAPDPMIVDNTFDGSQSAGFDIAITPQPVAAALVQPVVSTSIIAPPVMAIAPPPPTDPNAGTVAAPILPPPPPPGTNPNGGTNTVNPNTPVAPVVLNLNDMTNTPARGFFFVGDNTNSMFGNAIAAMGDVNGDGFEDINIVMGSNLFATAGVTFTLMGDPLVYNTAPRTALMTSGDMVARGLAFSGNPDDMVIAQIGDFRGNGQNYYVVGSQYADSDGPTSFSGQARIFNQDGTYVTELSSLVTGDMAGMSVAGIGDINRDGRADVLIGSPGGASADGEAYVLFGRASSPAEINVNAMGSNGFRITGIANFGELGTDVSGAGDFNSDGYDDFIISIPGANEAHIVFGHAGINSVALTTAGTLNDTLRISGVGVAANMSMPLLSLGDMNGDGISDIGVASTQVGAESINIFFGAQGAGEGNETTGSADFRIVRNAGDTRSISGGGAAGDFNGDGLDDLVVVMSGTGGATDIYVVYGKEGMNGAMLTGNLNDPNNAFHMVYNAGGHLATQFNVSRAGDLNGDGFEDIAIGMPEKDTNSDGTADGAMLIVYGRETSVAGIVKAQPNATANAGDQNLVGNQGINILNDGGHFDTSMSGGAGDDRLQIRNLNFDRLDGGTGMDHLDFMQAPGSVINLTAMNSEDIRGMEYLHMSAAGGQTLVLSLENIFNLMKQADNNRLFIDSNGRSDNALHIDASESGGLALDPIVTAGDMQALLGASTPTVVNGYYEFHIAGNTLAIDQNLFTNNQIAVVA